MPPFHFLYDTLPRLTSPHPPPPLPSLDFPPSASHPPLPLSLPFPPLSPPQSRIPTLQIKPHIRHTRNNAIQALRHASTKEITSGCARARFRIEGVGDASFVYAVYALWGERGVSCILQRFLFLFLSEVK